MHLRVATFHPRPIALLRRPKHGFIDLRYALLRRTRGNRQDPQRLAPILARTRQERAFRTCVLIQQIQNRGGFDQRLAVGLHQDGDPAQGIELPDQLEIFADGPIAVLERHSEQIHAHRDPAHEGRIKHTDENQANMPPKKFSGHP